MKNIKMAIILLTFSLVSTMSFAKKISAVKHYDTQVTILPSLGLIYKKVNMVVCSSDMASTDLRQIDMYYKGTKIGTCQPNHLPSIGGNRINEITSSEPITITLRSNLPYDYNNVYVVLYDYIVALNSVMMGTSDVPTVRGVSSISANVVDSVTFSELKSGSMASKPLLLPTTDTPGKVTIRPSEWYQGKGIIKDEGGGYFLPYTVDGGEWSEKDSGWVITATQQSEPHNITINPDRIKLHPGNYSGYVTVEIAAE